MQTKHFYHFWQRYYDEYRGGGPTWEGDGHNIHEGGDKRCCEGGGVANFSTSRPPLTLYACGLDREVGTAIFLLTILLKGTSLLYKIRLFCKQVFNIIKLPGARLFRGSRETFCRNKTRLRLTQSKPSIILFGYRFHIFLIFDFMNLFFRGR